MGRNCPDRRCSTEWDSFIAIQAYSTLCKSKTMKEVKSGDRQKIADRWEEWFSETSICHKITLQRVKSKRMYVVWSCHYSLVFHPPLQHTVVASLAPSSHPPITLCSPCSALVSPPSNHAALRRGSDTPRLLCAKDDPRLRSLRRALEQTRVPPLPNAPALTACDTLPHEFERKKDLLVAFQKQVIFL